MDDAVAQDISDFQRAVDKRFAVLKPHPKTEEAVRLLVQYFQERLQAISVAPFGARERQKLLRSARADFLADLDAMGVEQERNGFVEPQDGPPDDHPDGGLNG